MIWDSIREAFGSLIGKRLIDITEADPEERDAGQCFVMLMFEDGSYLKFPTDERGIENNVTEDDDNQT